MIILFDLDGTLIDSSEAIIESFYHSFDYHNFTRPNQADIHCLVGLPLDIMFEKLGVNQNVDSYVQVYKEHYRTISIPKTKLLDTAYEAVELASTFAHLGVVTTKTGRYSKELLDAFGILNKFKVIVGREDVTKPKPDKEPIETALKSFKNVELDKVWMIGDTCLDIEASKSAKTKHIGLLGGHGLEKELNVCSEIIFDNVLEGIRYIQKLQ